jgi:hypothetical protein
MPWTVRLPGARLRATLLRHCPSQPEPLRPESLRDGGDCGRHLRDAGAPRPRHRQLHFEVVHAGSLRNSSCRLADTHPSRRSSPVASRRHARRMIVCAGCAAISKRQRYVANVTRAGERIRAASPGNYEIGYQRKNVPGGQTGPAFAGQTRGSVLGRCRCACERFNRRQTGSGPACRRQASGREFERVAQPGTIDLGVAEAYAWVRLDDADRKRILAIRPR